MSRGPGKMQNAIMRELRGSSTPLSASDLRQSYELETFDESPKRQGFEAWNTAARRHSIRMSMGRALRQLEAAGQIKRDVAGDWYPSKGWTARNHDVRERAIVAYHEAGHAVIGLALKMPVAFVTIKPSGRSGGHVSLAPVPYSVGNVYARGQYRKLVAEIEQDPFGNKVEDTCNENYWHSDAMMRIAGGMVEAEFLKNGRPWRELASPGDMRGLAFARRKLGDKARSVEEYEAECETLIKQHWTLIEAVAKGLLKEETLSGEDVYNICWCKARNVVRRQRLES
jgi:Peptidase family M41